MEEELTNPETLKDRHVSGLVGTPAPPKKEVIIRKKYIRRPKYLKNGVMR